MEAVGVEADASASAHFEPGLARERAESEAIAYFAVWACDPAAAAVVAVEAQVCLTAVLGVVVAVFTSWFAGAGTAFAELALGASHAASAAVVGVAVCVGAGVVAAGLAGATKVGAALAGRVEGAVASGGCIAADLPPEARGAALWSR